MNLSVAEWSFVGQARPNRSRFIGRSESTILTCSRRAGRRIDVSTSQLSLQVRSVKPARFEPWAQPDDWYGFVRCNFSERALSRHDPAIRTHNLTLATFCQSAGIPSTAALAGVDQPGWTHGKSPEIPAKALNELAAVCTGKGMRLLLEPHVQSVRQSPAEVLRFLVDNGALGLRLDFAHFICTGYRQADVDHLAPYDKHVHLRQAAPGATRSRWAN